MTVALPQPGHETSTEPRPERSPLEEWLPLAERPDGRTNAAVVGGSAVLAALSLVLALAWSDRLPTIQPALPVFHAVAVCAAAVAAYLLRARARALADERLDWLAGGYAVAGLAMALQVLGFTGFFPGGGVLDTTSSGAAALYLLWHVAVPTAALAALAVRRRASGTLRPGPHRVVLRGLGLGLTVACGYAAWGASPLPSLIGPDGRYTALLNGSLAVLAAYSVVAAAAWARAVGRRPTWVEAWITVSLAFGAWDVVLHAFAEQRFTPFWWASLVMRLAQFGVLAAGLLAGFVALFDALDGYSRGLGRRLEAERLRARRDQEARRRAERNRAEAAARIRRVLDGDGPSVVFQPIVDLRSGAVVGGEALARFAGDPPRPPNLWFDEAAAVGLGVELELAVARAALVRLPQVAEPLFLSLNVSPAALASDHLARLLADGLGRHAKGRVVVEVTEHARVDDYDALTAAVRRLRGLGVRLAVDDVGAGFSSLRHILRLEPDIVKLDVALTRGIDRDPVCQALAASLVAFGRETGVQVVAEGIETERELEALRSLGVDWGQGYHLARPGPLPLPAVTPGLAPFGLDVSRAGAGARGPTA